MGEITTTGYAKKNIKCDLVNFTFTFIADRQTVHEAVKAANDATERFLAIMEERGVSAEKFVIQDNSANQNYYDGDKPKYRAKHEISLLAEMSGKTCAAVYGLINEQKLNVLVEEEYSCSDIEEQHKQLLKSAIDNARAKADMAAEAAGSRVVGIKSIDLDPSDNAALYMNEECVRCIAPSEPSRMEALGSPETEEEEHVKVVWLIE